MKLTEKQKKTLLPYVQGVVQGVIDTWESERCIERILGKSFDGMTQAAQDMAIAYDSGEDVTLEEVQAYIDSCTED
jgi:hypothetical protein